jgi:hypothetical protein
MHPAGLEPTTAASGRPQTLALVRSANGIGFRSADRPARSKSLYQLKHLGPHNPDGQTAWLLRVDNCYFQFYNKAP